MDVRATMLRVASMRSKLKTPRKKPIDFRIHLTKSQAEKEMGHERRVKCAAAELQQMFLDKKVLSPVMKSNVPRNSKRKPIRLSCRYDVKYDGDGVFDKDKARIVATELKKDSDLTEKEKKSPTVNTQVVFATAAIAKAEGRKVMTADVSGAFLLAKPKREVHLLMPKDLTTQLLEMYPGAYDSFVNEDGTMWTKADKAIYGTGDASKLWHDLVDDTMIKDGYTQNPYDRCCYNKMVDGVQITVLLHVDDFFMTSKSQKALDEAKRMLMSAFDKVTFHEGLVHNYLKMKFDFTNAQYVSINQYGFIHSLTEYYNVTETELVPAEKDLRKIPDSPMLNESAKDGFHSLAYKMLYLAKRTRPDILVATHFLSTRVQHPTQADAEKAYHCLRYLNGTKDLGLRLNAFDPTHVIQYIDAAHAVHDNMKSHSGSVTTLGLGSIDSGSTALDMNTKSACESEYISMSDNVTNAIFMRNFLIAQGYDEHPAVIMQDNEAAIKLAENGFSSAMRTRHINIRYFFVKDRIAKGEIEVKYCPTKLMIADCLTKPVQGQLFLELRDLLLGYKQA